VCHPKSTESGRRHTDSGARNIESTGRNASSVSRRTDSGACRSMGGLNARVGRLSDCGERLSSHRERLPARRARLSACLGRLSSKLGSLSSNRRKLPSEILPLELCHTEIWGLVRGSGKRCDHHGLRGVPRKMARRGTCAGPSTRRAARWRLPSYSTIGASTSRLGPVSGTLRGRPRGRAPGRELGAGSGDKTSASLPERVRRTGRGSAITLTCAASVSSCSAYTRTYASARCAAWSNVSCRS
jgi:hypothetical protein